MSRRPPLLILAALLLGGCADEVISSVATVDERCSTLIDAMARCQPELAQEAICTAETLAQIEDAGLAGASCDAVEKAGKADWFAAGGCGAGEHVCGWVFCCDDYDITWTPSRDSDWDIVGVVDDMRDAAPGSELTAVAHASRDALLDGVSVNFEQSVLEFPGEPARDMGVEISALLVEVPVHELVSVLPVADWGVDLAGYLGGEIEVYDRGPLGRPTRQLERMVLRPVPFAIEHQLLNNDMTKVEVIEYAEDGGGIVYWRVMFSNNGSTETDVGCVEFRRYDDRATLVTFHSAHRLNALGGIHIPNSVVKKLLSVTFLGFLKHYRELVRDRLPG